MAASSARNAIAAASRVTKRPLDGTIKRAPYVSAAIATGP